MLYVPSYRFELTHTISFKYAREKWRAKEEEEERRRGEEHIDALLDQSGHIFQSQQVSLSRTTQRPTLEASARSQSHLSQGVSDDDSDDETEEEQDTDETEISSNGDTEEHKDDTVALLNGSGPSSPPETDVDHDRPTTPSRHTSVDDIDQFPITPSSPEAIDTEDLLQLSDPVGDGIPVQPRPPDPIKEFVVSVSSPAEFPPGSSEPDNHVLGVGLARPPSPGIEDDVDDEVIIQDDGIVHYLRPYAVTKVEGRDPDRIIKPSPLLRGSLRPYQRAGLEWLANHHTQSFNCILADEMGRLCRPRGCKLADVHTIFRPWKDNSNDRLAGSPRL